MQGSFERAASGGRIARLEQQPAQRRGSFTGARRGRKPIQERGEQRARPRGVAGTFDGHRAPVQSVFLDVTPLRDALDLGKLRGGRLGVTIAEPRPGVTERRRAR